MCDLIGRLDRAATELRRLRPLPAEDPPVRGACPGCGTAGPWPLAAWREHTRTCEGVVAYLCRLEREAAALDRSVMPEVDPLEAMDIDHQRYLKRMEREWQDSEETRRLEAIMGMAFHGGRKRTEPEPDAEG